MRFSATPPCHAASWSFLQATAILLNGLPAMGPHLLHFYPSLHRSQKGPSQTPIRPHSTLLKTLHLTSSPWLSPCNVSLTSFSFVLLHPSQDR